MSRPSVYIKDRTSLRLSQLIRCALRGEEPDPAFFAHMTKKEWKSLYDLSIRQGVLAIAYDGVTQLPERLLPPLDMRISWELSSKKIEGRYRTQIRSLVQLTTLYRKEKIETLLFKGLGTSLHYPIPSHRECGDLDIFLFGKSKAGNKLVEKEGIHVHYSTEKHSTFHYHHTPVENHLTFLNTERTLIDRELEVHLQETVKNDKGTYIEEWGVYIPNPLFDLLFHFKHALTHFLAQGIVCRHLCDWSLLIRKHYRTDEYKKFREIISLYHLDHFADSLTRLAAELTGLKEEEIPVVHEQPGYTLRMWKEIEGMERIRHEHKHRNKIKEGLRLTRSVFRFMQSRWKYSIIGPKAFQEEFKRRVSFRIDNGIIQV